MKLEWVIYAVALAVVLGAYKIFSNSKGLPSPTPRLSVIVIYPQAPILTNYHL